MFEDNAINELSRLFDIPCVEYSGQQKNGGTLYLTWDDIKVIIEAETSKLTKAICTISLVCIDGREGIGFLSGKLFDFDSKDEDFKIKAVDNSEYRNWLSESVFECSKQIEITHTTDFNRSREKIENFKLIEG